jgi:response regulator RpfG family c-di-GMP phosphodiesterase
MSAAAASLHENGEDAAQPRVLCVDDEPNILEGFARSLGRDYDVVTAASGADALARLRDQSNEAPFAVIMSDMRMPGMDGATFLSRAANEYPDSTRILLTGQADLISAVAAVNEGRIFRFLFKPCASGVLRGQIAAAVEQNRLVRAERELLERTVHGCVRLLTEVLAVASPITFRQGALVKRIVAAFASRLGLPDSWKYETAAMLAQLGCIAIPGDVLERAAARMTLSAAEREMIEAHPESGQRMLSGIPRLEQVAAMIGRQRSPASPNAPSNDVERGAAMIRVATLAAELIDGGKVPAEAAAVLGERLRGWDLRLVEILADVTLPTGAKGEVRPVTVRALRPGMLLMTEVRGKNGVTLCTKGCELTKPLIERIHRFAQGVGVMEPLRVCDPE